MFRRRFLEELRVAHDAGRLGFFGDLAHLAKPDAFARLLAEVRRLEWVVYAKPPAAGRRGTVRNSVREAMMMEKRESSHGY
ncbi:hypothetical protein X743_31985 [Mesorhizobium sp. LNHC252B00]|nr:hypothetical protein X743_31985 [Mesorhizobium sp. LNHC252B00]